MFTTNHFIRIGDCAASELSKVMSDMIESPKGGMHPYPLSLPFHLCRLMIFAVLFITFGQEGKTKRLMTNDVRGVLPVKRTVNN